MFSSSFGFVLDDPEDKIGLTISFFFVFWIHFEIKYTRSICYEVFFTYDFLTAFVLCSVCILRKGNKYYIEEINIDKCAKSREGKVREKRKYFLKRWNYSNNIWQWKRYNNEVNQYLLFVSKLTTKNGIGIFFFLSVKKLNI